MDASSGLPPVPLPPYQPDGSLPPMPLEEVTAKGLIARYEISKQTLYTRLAACGVCGTKRGKQVFFNNEEVFRLDAGHHFLSKGYGLKDLREACAPSPSAPADELVDVGDPVSSSSPRGVGAHAPELTIAPQQERVVMALTTAVQQALQATAPLPPSDPLRPYRLMQEAAENKYQLTSRSLAEILELNISTVHSWGKIVSRNGFRIRRVGSGRWRVDIEEEVEDQAA